MENIRISHALVIPLSEIRFRYSRSGGKGGQNVNKVETKVELLFDVAYSPGLSDEQRDLLFKKLKSCIGADGMLRIVSQESRSQWKNRETAVKKFAELLHSALKVRKKRRATKAHSDSVEKRLKEKKIRGNIKSSRKKYFRDIE